MPCILPILWWFILSDYLKWIFWNSEDLFLSQVPGSLHWKPDGENLFLPCLFLAFCNSKMSSDSFILSCIHHLYKALDTCSHRWRAAEKQKLLGWQSTVESVTKILTHSIITLYNKTVLEKEERVRTRKKQKLNKTKEGNSTKQGMWVRSGKSSASL